ncbi:unnamed protein product [Arctogadus glacialis]
MNTTASLSKRKQHCSTLLLPSGKAFRKAFEEGLLPRWMGPKRFPLLTYGWRERDAWPSPAQAARIPQYTSNRMPECLKGAFKSSSMRKRKADAEGIR